MKIRRVLAHALIATAAAAAASSLRPPATNAAGPRIAFERDGWVWKELSIVRLPFAGGPPVVVVNDARTATVSVPVSPQRSRHG